MVPERYDARAFDPWFPSLYKSYHAEKLRCFTSDISIDLFWKVLIVRTFSILLLTGGCIGTCFAVLMTLFWLSDPADMTKENNPFTMAAYGFLAFICAGAMFVGVRGLKRKRILSRVKLPG